MNKCFILTLCILLFSGCAKTSSESPQIQKIQINRTFEDITLGMSEDEFKSKLVWFRMPSPPRLTTVYSVYDIYYNIYLTTKDKPKMREIDNIYAVYCEFLENKLLGFSINYRIDYQPAWNNFIYNAEQKYGKGEPLSSGNGICWDDGKTFFSISIESDQQLISYGKHFIVTYNDAELVSRKVQMEKEKSPAF
ncbi:MAG: hypothetical protein KKB82_03750 [Candidatus Omnitrophica bacterium]|nr:hypothetical protein [Candidatus Omnitrophota bacterium]MBU1925019.1 hypothetical protein [Candidatus Omnitrophota bacterium]